MLAGVGSRLASWAAWLVCGSSSFVSMFVSMNQFGLGDVFDGLRGGLLLSWSIRVLL
jgi:hypothetical protein